MQGLTALGLTARFVGGSLRFSVDAWGRRARTTVGILEIAFIAVGIAAALMLIELVIRRSDVGAALVLGVLLLEESNLVTLAVEAGPVRVQAVDLVFVVLVTAAVARLLRAERLTTVQRLVVAFGVIAAWALARGTGPFGIPAAVNEARRFLWFLGPVLYFSTVELRRDLLDRIGALWLLTAGVLAAMTVVRWFAHGVGISGGFFGSSSSLRVVPAAVALIMAQAAFLALPLLVTRAAGWRRFLAPSFLVLVVLLQHRTVWVVAAAGVLLLFYLDRQLSRRALTALAAVLVLFAALVFTVFDDRDIDISEQLASSASSTATFEWRVEGWTSLMTESGPEGLEEQLLGRPFGSGWGRTLPGGRVIDAHIQPHNFYVEALLRVGIVGVLLVALLYAIALRGTLAAGRRRTQHNGLLSPHVLFAMIAGQLVYYLTYAPDASQGILLGLGLAVAARSMPRQVQPATVRQVSV
jgi:O-antigen ligase